MGPNKISIRLFKDTGELLFQMIGTHQKMIEMSRRAENLINDAKMEIKLEPISDEEEDWGMILLPHTNLPMIGMLSQIIHPSTFLLQGL